jgi:hypothetical protein
MSAVVADTLQGFLAAAFLHDFEQPMREKGLTCPEDIERELNLPGSDLIEALGMQPTEAKRLHRRLHPLEDPGSTTGGEIMMMTTTTNLSVSVAAPGPQAGDGQTSDWQAPGLESLFACISCCCCNCAIYKAFPQCLGCTNKGSCCCYQGAALCRLSVDDPALYHFGGARQFSCCGARCPAHDPRLTHAIWRFGVVLAGVCSYCRLADLTGPNNECCKQASRCVCCCCFESANKSACAMPKTCCLGWDQCCCCALRCNATMPPPPRHACPTAYSIVAHRRRAKQLVRDACRLLPLRIPARARS